jgi:hypothetical protein
MSCSPGSPCYNNDTNCTGDPCNSSNAISCETVFYNGPTLPTTGIDSCTNICVALQEIDNTISEIITGSTTTASNGLTKVGDDIRLGGALTQTTVISTGPYDLVLTGIDTGASTDDLLVLTPGGVVKKVAASSLAPTITLTPNTGLDWTDAPANTELRTLYNTLIDDDAQSIELGGAVSHPASYWKTKTFVEMFDEILFPTQYPTYTVPTLSLTGTSSATYEIGTAVTFSLVAKGSAWDGGAITTITYSKVVNGGSPTLTPNTSFTNGATTPFGSEFSFLDPNSPNTEKIAPSLPETSYAIPAPTSGPSSTVVYSSSMIYGNGQPKLTSLNSPDGRSAILPPYATPTISTGPIGGGTITSSSITLTGIYPIFYGAIANGQPHDLSDIASFINSNSATKSVVSGAGTITAAFGTQSQKWFFIAVPSGAIGGYAAKTTFNPLWFPIPTAFSPSAAWDIVGTVNVTSPTSLWSSIQYRIYRTNYVTDTAGSIEIY